MAVGDNWLAKVIGAIEHGPDWSSTAIFLTWDDCGCFYDHVVPPAGESVRVPMIVISPYARAAYTDSRDATFTSVLAFIEHDFYLPALSSLDAHSYNFLGSFDFAQKPLGPVPLTTTKISSTEQQKIKANPPDPDDPT
jgi:phospholipase C